MLGGGVVVERMDGMFAKIEALGEHIVMQDCSSELQITVGNRASGVGEGHQTALDMSWHLLPPNNRTRGAIGGGSECDAAHSKTRSICGPNDGRLTWDQLSQSGGAIGQIIR